MLSLTGPRVQSLVGELKSLKPHGMAKKIKNKSKKIKIKILCRNLMHKTGKSRSDLTKVQVRVQEPSGSASHLPFELELLGKAKVAFENHWCVGHCCFLLGSPVYDLPPPPPS